MKNSWNANYERGNHSSKKIIKVADLQHFF